ncbi:OB-fold protein [Nonlabens xiamenensis]|uniref:OB-fold protein n=1 Tax=Nonlabens xiamenensis TaxID=2341043 RepID=UPI000F60CC0A|nr:hypothetical protein [Nonlabens xiamenensis]
MKKILLVVLILIALVGLSGYYFIYQDHRDIASEDAIATYEADELLAIFQDADTENDRDIIDQVIQVQGKITSQESFNITLDNKVFIELAEELSSTNNTVLMIKGRCVGYDDLLEEIKIDQAIIINNP